MQDEPRHWSESRSEAEEAEWWDRNQEYAEGLVERAVNAGETTTVEEVLRRQAESLTIRLSNEDREKLHRLAARVGKDDESYAASVLHRALADVEKRGEDRP